MPEKIHENVEQQIKELPHPVLTAEKQKEMLENIHICANKHNRRKKWGNVMKRVYVGTFTIAALIFLSVLTYIQIADKNSSSESIEKNSTQSESGVVSEYIDPPGLTAHQLALNDLYVEIPYQKQNVNITKRTTDEHIIVDVKDKETGELLYTYGESIGHGKEKVVFREIQTKNTKIRLQMFVEIDPMKNLITKVNRTEADYDQKPEKIELEMINSGSRSGEFPTDNVELLAKIVFYWGSEYQDLYEGYVIGVIK